MDSVPDSKHQSWVFKEEQNRISNETSGYSQKSNRVFCTPSTPTNGQFCQWRTTNNLGIHHGKTQLMTKKDSYSEWFAGTADSFSDEKTALRSKQPAGVAKPNISRSFLSLCMFKTKQLIWISVSHCWQYHHYCCLFHCCWVYLLRVSNDRFQDNDQNQTRILDCQHSKLLTLLTSHYSPSLTCASTSHS